MFHHGCGNSYGGVSRGIGRATAIKLSENFFVVMNYLRNEEKAMKTVAAIQNAGGKATMVQGDVSNYEDARNIVKRASEIGELRVLVNNAGVYNVKPLVRMLPSEWEYILREGFRKGKRVTLVTSKPSERGCSVGAPS